LRKLAKEALTCAKVLFSIKCLRSPLSEIYHRYRYLVISPSPNVTTGISPYQMGLILINTTSFPFLAFLSQFIAIESVNKEIGIT